MADHKILSEFVLSWESDKYTENKYDNGGATKYGITLNTWRKVGYDKDGDFDIDKEDVKLLTKADYDRVFKRNYWDACKADLIEDQSVANLLVDYAYNSGVSRAVKAIQKIVGVSCDGVVGKFTLAAINNYKRGQPMLFCSLVNSRRSHYYGIAGANSNQKRYLSGWLNRLNSIGYGSLKCNGGRTIKF